MYRHLNSNIDIFLNDLHSVIDIIHQEKKLCVMPGDFNLNLLNYESHPPTEEFINTLNSYFLELHIIKPTRITTYSATLIDNIFFNSIDNQTLSGNLLYDLTDHLPNFLIISRLNMSTNKEKIYKRDYSNYNEESFIKEFSSIDWTTVLNESQNVSQMFEQFYFQVSDVIDRNAPLKPLSRKESKFYSKPWITEGLKTSINNTNRLYRLILKEEVIIVIVNTNFTKIN